MMLIDLRNKGITGKEAEKVLVRADITANKNMVPFDDQSPFVTSGIRFGVAAVTTRGLKEGDMEQIVGWIDRVLLDPDSEAAAAAVRKEVNAFMGGLPLFAG
jgi:glycine hydroxymethyltransferase